MDRDSIQELLATAVHAPSESNCQPWRFRIETHAITIYAVPDRSPSPRNFKNRCTFVAHGALIENIAILAAEKGYAIYVELFGGEENCTARLTFTASDALSGTFYKNIKDRTSNRKAYQRKSLSIDDRSALSDSIAKTEGVSLRLIEGDDAGVFAKVASLKDRLIFEHQGMYDRFFDSLRWSDEEAARKPGIHVRSLEYSWPVRLLLQHVLRNWIVVRILDQFGLSRLMQALSARRYRASSAFGALIIANESDASFVSAGRALERLWLMATKLRLSMQILWTVPFLSQRVRANDAGEFTEEQRTAVTYADNFIKREFGVRDHEVIAMLFRIGYGGEPTERSVKLAPAILQDSGKASPSETTLS